SGSSARRLRGRGLLLHMGWNLPAGRFQYVVLCAATVNLKRAQEVDKIPGVIRLNGVGIGGHGSTVEASHENPVDVSIRGTALKPRVVPALNKVVRPDGLILAVGQRRCRRAVSLPLRPVTFPAFQFCVQRFAMGNAFNGYGRLGRNRDRLASFLLLP